MSKSNTVHCILGMLGTDVHSKGIRTLARLLDEAGGIDVNYLGEHNSVEGMADAVAAGKADIVGVSFSSAAYVEYTRQLIEAMKAKGVGHVPVILGGIIHPDDIPELKAMGVAGLFGAGSKTEDIIQFIQAAGAPPV
ncbi:MULTISPECIES: cobalamin B12-binding domain-containing protein [Sphingobium]|uniref:cobalamin B12-binding domain-containing protein n=1 Tax=Sphingobium TaxID=165695 RepID=UPI00159C8C2E|nr:cobalamin-dependent protein [Sphingobium sp. 15-1]